MSKDEAMEKYIAVILRIIKRMPVQSKTEPHILFF